MVSSRALAIAASLVGIFVYRSGRLAKNSILSIHPFPTGYFSEGEFGTACSTVDVPEFKYCEDLTSWEHLDAKGKFLRHTVLISCDPNRKNWNTVMGPLTNPDPKGSLWVYEPDTKTSNGASGKLDASKLTRLELKGYPENHDFHPLGLEAYPSFAGNNSNLYVVNHARKRTVIEQFVLSPSKPNVATWVRTLSSPYFLSANALSLTSPDSFYVTNDHLFTRRIPVLGHIIPIIESILGLPFSFISHVSLSPTSSSIDDLPITGHQFSVLFMPFSNGVSLSPSGTQVAIVSTTLAKVFIYARDPKTNVLTQTAAVPVPFVPDNIHYTHDGQELIVTGHPSFPVLTQLAGKKVDAAPSWVMSISLTGSDQINQDFDLQAPISGKGMVPAVKGFELKTLFQSNGTGFSSSSTALKDPVTGDLYVSGLYSETGIIKCHPANN